MKKLLLLFFLFTICSSTFSNVIVTQKNWRWRKDDGSQTTATLRGKQNDTTQVTSISEVLRLRIEFTIRSSNDEKADVSSTKELSYDTSPTGTFTEINSDPNTSNHFVFTLSNNFAHGDPTTRQMSPHSGNTFLPGKMFESAAGEIVFSLGGTDAAKATEHEWSIKLTKHAIPGTTYYFKLPVQTGEYDAMPALYYAGIGCKITSTVPSPTTSKTIPVTITFDEDVTGFELKDLKLSGPANLANFAGSGKTYTVDIVATNVGNMTLEVVPNAATGVSGAGTGKAIFQIAYSDPNCSGSPISNPGFKCGPGEVFLASGGGTEGNYRWYTSLVSEPIPGETGATFVTPHLTASKIYYVSIVNGDCESARVPITAQINAVPETPVITENIGEDGSYTLTSSSEEGNQWYREGLLIEGAKSQILEVNERGIYTVVVTIDGCASEMSQPLNVTADEKSINDYLKAYPNPVKGKFVVTYSESKRGDVKVFDLMGKQRASKPLVQSTAEFDFSNFEQGFYIVQVVSGGKKSFVKIIKE